MQAVRPEDLDKKIQSNKYDILHYFGHARFDDGKEEGYLKLERPEAEPFRLYANDFAMMFANKKIRLVFLNGCETGRNSKNEDPARSSIAAALLARGVPAIIATQFSIPDVTAHYLSNTTYNSLLTGQPLVEAMRNGRRAMRFSEQSRITDWGIPVLYTTDPELIIFPKPKYKRIGWAAAYDEALKSDDMLSSLETAGKPNAPSVTVERTAILEKKRMARMSVALVDFDAKVGFLPDLVEQANDVQTFYNFEVNYLPMPTVAIRQGLKDAYGKKVGPQLYLPHVEDYLVKAPANLQVDKLCCLTRYWVAGRDKKGKQFEDYRASALNTSEDVLAISVVKLRDYAQQAAISYPKAVLYVCLSLIVASDQRLPAMFHKKTSGCLFDYCENQDDIVVGLKKMQFDHAKCRQLIKDKKQLKAIDALLALDLHGSDSV
jgi:hypothetical protein